MATETTIALQVYNIMIRKRKLAIAVPVHYKVLFTLITTAHERRTWHSQTSTR